jgi:hypothetical protein
VGTGRDLAYHPPARGGRPYPAHRHAQTGIDGRGSRPTKWRRKKANGKIRRNGNGSTEEARQGYVLLGSAEVSRGRLNAAADAWRTALATRFDPTLAAEAAEAMSEAEGRVTDEAAGLFRRALAESPADALWRPMAQKRLSELK